MRSSVRLLALTLVAALAPSGPASATGPNAVEQLPGCSDNVLPRNDDGSTGLVDLPFSMNFFGTTYGALFVNNNGNVTFNQRLSTFTPFAMTGATGTPIIAPFFGDVDTRAEGSDVVTYGATTRDGHPAFCVMWDGVAGVGYYSHHVDRLNKFQLLLVDRGDAGAGDFDIVFNYDQIQWETGDASGGSGGLGGQSARVGYSAGTGAPGTFEELPGSAVNGALLDGGANTLVGGSRGVLDLGRYLFQVRGGLAPVGGTVFGQVTTNPPVPGALVQVCGEVFGCLNAVTNSQGNYAISGLPADTYTARGFPPAGSNRSPGEAGPGTLTENGVLRLDIVLPGPVPPPEDVTIGPLRSTTPDGIPVVYWNDELLLEKEGQCPGAGVVYEVRKGGDSDADGLLDQVIQGGGMGEEPTGPTSTYRATIPPLAPNSGPAQIVIRVDCPPSGPGPEDNVQIFNIYIDPSGLVRTTTGTLIVGATVTLYRSDSSSGPFEVVPDGSAVMSPSNRTNPDTTDAVGHFGWDVIAGFYVVRAEAEGCHAPGEPLVSFVESAVMTIPPPVTDLDLRLECLASNAPPVADAGDDQTVEWTAGGTSVSLDGTGSSDPDADTLTYLWTGGFAGGTTVGDAPTVTFGSLGTFQLTLMVSDGELTSTDEVQVFVVDTTAPAVLAGLVHVGGTSDPGDDQGRTGKFRVDFSCTDAHSVDAGPAAELNGIQVSGGEVVQLIEKKSGPQSAKRLGNGRLQIKATSFELVASCADESGNEGMASVVPVFPGS